jgi:hypothetical protein
MDESLRVAAPLRVRSVLGDAVRVYRLLFVRSVTTAAVVYAAIALIDILHHANAGSAAQALAVVSTVLGLAGPLVVQGALVAIVRNVHVGRPPERIGELFRLGGGRFWPLLGASLLYGFGVFLALLLLIVPGLILAARWSLLAPLVVLERRGVDEARRRSSELVKGHTGAVLGCVFLTLLIVSLIVWPLALTHLSFGTSVFLSFLWSALTAPFEAHVLTVIYYRLADPDRPVIDPSVTRWHSVWDGR